MDINIGLTEQQRADIAAGLSKVLADSYTLYLKTHNFHWNVEGPQFQALHMLFEQQYVELATAVDVIAERIRALGYPAPGSYAAFSKLTSIVEDESVPAAEEMIRQLVLGHEEIIRSARALLKTAENAGDAPTAGLMAERMQLHEKTAWMLRSLLVDKQ